MFIDDVSISGFKVALSDPSAAERATEVMVQDGEDAQSPEAVSATSQSTDEHAKDLVLPSLTLLCTIYLCFCPTPYLLCRHLSLSHTHTILPFTVFSLCIVLNASCVCTRTTAGVGAGPEGAFSVCLSECER